MKNLPFAMIFRVLTLSTVLSLCADPIYAIAGFHESKQDKGITDTTVSEVKDKAYYLDRSRHQRTSALIVGPAGLLITCIAFPKAVNDLNGDSGAGFFVLLGMVLFIVGIVGGIKSGTNKRIAKLYPESQKLSLGIPKNTGKTVSGITLSIPIGK